MSPCLVKSYILFWIETFYPASPGDYAEPSCLWDASFPPPPVLLLRKVPRLNLFFLCPVFCHLSRPYLFTTPWWSFIGSDHILAQVTLLLDCIHLALFPYSSGSDPSMFAALQVVFWPYSLWVKSVQEPICISLCHALAQPTQYNVRSLRLF